MNWLLVALGGAAGAVARYGAGRWVGVPAGAGFPWATFGVNVAGSLLLGIVVALVPPDDPRRALLAVGFCGGLTTFSTFGYETMVLWQHRVRRGGGLRGPQSAVRFARCRAWNVGRYKAGAMSAHVFFTGFRAALTVSFRRG
ncbi:MAG TPA: CrcB family protein [Longimicrobium sp.]|uniref:fluoride efflux transporter FluC n=1 Tax=Longimicrobium sp. TaxID=2029185 RepID=UPI002ED7A122